MGNLNMKLMRGAEEAEKQMQKQTQELEEAKSKEAETRDTKETDRKPQKAVKQPRTKKNTGMGKNNEKETDKMLNKQAFSFRAVLTDIAVWKAYAVATGQTVESIGNSAMNEYLKKHKLSGAEWVIFDAIKARDANDK